MTAERRGLGKEAEERYIMMTTKAAELERSGEYCSAAKAWRHDALFALHQKNEVWAESRAVLCSCRVPVERGSST